MLTIIIILTISIFINGAFSMAEMAMVSSRKARLQQALDHGERSAQTAIELSQKPNQFLSTVQVGITLLGIFSGVLGGSSLEQPLSLWLSSLNIPLITDLTDEISLFVVVSLLTFCSLVFGELVPKRLALHSPERIAMLTAPMMKWASIIASPINYILNLTTDFILRLFRISPVNNPEISEEELKILIEQGAEDGIFEETESDMVKSVFRLSNRSVDAIMTPRTEIVWLDIDEPFETNLHKVLGDHHSNFPVAQGNLDNVIGILHAKDLLAINKNGNSTDLHSILFTPSFVPESMPALKAMDMIKLSSIHTALVIDEYGGLIGMVTLFDILESIVGDIPTSGETDSGSIIQREDGSWLVDGLLPIDEFKDVFEINTLPEEDHAGYQTLGGFIMSSLGAIPEEGQIFSWNNFHFEILDMDGRRIDKVLVRRSSKNHIENINK